MRANELRHRLTIQTATETQNAGGEPIPSWGTYATVNGAIEPLSGRESEVARQTYGEVSHRIRIRSRSGVVSKMRILKGSRTFEIQGVLNIEERGREMHLFCTEHV